MKKFLVIIMSALLLLVACTGLTACGNDKGQTGKTLYVYTHTGFMPYEYVNASGNATGVDIDIMKEVASVLGYNVVINDVEFNSILNEVSKNQYAIGAAGMSKKAERDAVATASIQYAVSKQYVIAPVGTFEAGQKVTLDDIANILGTKSVGVQKGTTGADLIEATTSPCKAKAVEYSNAIVASGDIGTALNAVVIDKMPAESIVKSKSATLACWELDADPESYVFYLNKNATQLISDVNKVLQVMIDNGVIDYYTIKHSGGILG